MKLERFINLNLLGVDEVLGLLFRLKELEARPFDGLHELQSFALVLENLPSLLLVILYIFANASI